MAALRRRRPLANTPSSIEPTAPGLQHVVLRALGPLRSTLGDVLEFLLPQRCPGCGVPADPARLLCARCIERLPVLDVPICARCLREGQPPDRCARHPGDRVHVAWVYDERVALIVHALKFGGQPGLAIAYAGAIARALPGSARRPDLVTSVPLHAARRRERGYDQAACIAEALADAIGVPFVPGVLRRMRATRAQSELGPAARRLNVLGAFEVTRPRWVTGRRVLLVDDVLTTGATMAECLGALRASRARTTGAALAWAQ